MAAVTMDCFVALLLAMTRTRSIAGNAAGAGYFAVSSAWAKSRSALVRSMA